jgi:hypothetical protein
MATSLKCKLRYKVQFPLHYAVDSMLVRMRAGSSEITRILIASDSLAFTSEQQFAPLLANRRRIADELAVVFDRQLMDDAIASPGPIAARYSAVFAKLSFQTPSEEAIEKIARLRNKLAPGVRLIYFDGDDDLCVQWGGLLEYVDLYVKKHVFADSSWYRKEFVGKNNLTDYVARVTGRSFAENQIPRSGTVADHHLGKIYAGYNIGLDEKITNLFRDTRPALPSEKTVDVMCRAACAPDNWLYSLRGKMGAALEPLTQQRFKILLPDRRVDQKAYYEEMRSSRISVSPFGYGEICWRDFEAVLMGSLLVKPDMCAPSRIFLFPAKPMCPCDGISATWRRCAHVIWRTRKSGIASRPRLIAYFPSIIRTPAFSSASPGCWRGRVFNHSPKEWRLTSRKRATEL